MNWTLLHNSMLLGASATAGAVVLGWIVALFLATLGPSGRAAGLALAAVALVLPPFLVTNCWLSLLGHAGTLRRWVPLEIYSLAGAAWILALLLWPLTTFLVIGAWQRLDPALLDSETALVGWSLVRHALWPVASHSVVHALVLTFVLAVNHFAVPAILQVKVLPAEIWLQFSTNFNIAGSLWAASPQLLAALALLLWLGRSEVSWPRWSAGLPAGLLRDRLGPWRMVAGGVTVAVVALSVAVPLGELALSRRTWLELPAAIAAGRSAIGTSVTLAVAVAVLTVTFGVVGWRWRCDRLLWLPFFVPGSLIGIGVIFLFNREPLYPVYQSLAVVIIAFGVRYAAVGWQGAAHARRAVDADLVNAGRLFGAAGWRLFRQVLWPQMAPQLLAAGYLVYLLALWDVETLVLIVPPGGETLALRIFNLLHYGHNAQVNALCLTLLAVALAPLIVWGIAVHARRWLDRTRARALTLAALATLVAGSAGCGRESSGTAPIESRFFSGVEAWGERGAGPGQFNKPRSLTVDREDNLYVVDMTGRVQKFAPDGTYLLAWQMPETDLGRAKGMGLDAEGRVIVIEPHYSRVNHFHPDGRLAHQWGTHETNGGALAFPRAVAVNSRGELWISEYGRAERVQRFSPDGSRTLVKREAAGQAPGQFNRVEGLGIAPGDRVYLADSCNHRIQVLDDAGELVRTFGRPGSGVGELSYPYDVRLDAAGNVFVCEFGNSRVQVFTPEGVPVEIIGGPGAAPGRFNNPWSLALDSQGNLYVADALNHRVQKFLRRRDRQHQAGAMAPAPASEPRPAAPGGRT